MNNQESNLSSSNDEITKKIIDRKKEPEPSGVLTFNLGDKIVYDMRKALNGKYEDTGLQAGDVVILSDKKIYRVIKKGKGKAMFIKMDMKAIRVLKDEIDMAIERMNMILPKREKFYIDPKQTMA